VRGHRCATIVQKSSGPSVEFIYRLVRGGTWFHVGRFAMMISRLTQKFRTALETPHFISVVQCRDAFLDGLFTISSIIFQDLTPCSNFSCIERGTLSNHDMDLTEEDTQIWYFGPDDRAPSSKCPPGLILVSQHTRRPRPHPSIPTIGDIKYLGESHCILYTH
jgi:hypothetical protein